MLEYNLFTFSSKFFCKISGRSTFFRFKTSNFRYTTSSGTFPLKIFRFYVHKSTSRYAKCHASSLKCRMQYDVTDQILWVTTFCQKTADLLHLCIRLHEFERYQNLYIWSRLFAIRLFHSIQRQIN